MGARWMDICGPTEKDLTLLLRTFRVHPIIIEELKTLSTRARVDHYKHYLYLSYHFPVYEPHEANTLRSEINFIITKDAVVALRAVKLEPLDNFGARPGESSIELLYRAIESLFHFQERQLRHIGEKVEVVGKGLFKNREKEVLTAISYLKRDISEYRIVVRLQESVLHSLLNHGVEFFGEDAMVYLNDLIGDHARIVNQVENYREAVADFEDTNNQLMDLKINTVMKTFTILSFLTFPFMLIAALFSMRTQGAPLENVAGAFWIVVGVMALGMITLITYFKKKGWF
jgi:magnesium transporter